MQHNWNVNTVMKCLKVFLRWRLDVTQTRCVNAVVQNKAFVYSSNLISSTPYWMFENAWLKPGCHCGPCPSLLSGHLTAQRRLWSWRRQKLSSSPCPPARSLSCWEACHLFAAPASRCSTELLSSHWGLAGALHSGNIAGILFSSRWWLFLHIASGSTMLYRSEVCCSHGLPMEMIPQWATQPQAKVVSFFSLPSHLTGAAGKGWSWPWGHLGL